MSFFYFTLKFMLSARCLGSTSFDVQRGARACSGCLRDVVCAFVLALPLVALDLQCKLRLGNLHLLTDISRVSKFVWRRLLMREGFVVTDCHPTEPARDVSHVRASCGAHFDAQAAPKARRNPR